MPDTYQRVTHQQVIDALRWTQPNPRRIPAIAGALKNANGQVVPHAAMIEAVYGHRPDGGPLTARKCIEIGVCELRKQGWKIKALKTIGWRLESAPCP